MQPESHPNQPLASIERHLVDLEYTIERQSIAIARLQDELDVSQALARLLLHRRADDVGRPAARPYRDLTRDEDEAVRDDGVRVRRVRRRVARNLVHVANGAHRESLRASPPESRCDSGWDRRSLRAWGSP